MGRGIYATEPLKIGLRRVLNLEEHQGEKLTKPEKNTKIKNSRVANRDEVTGDIFSVNC